MLRLHLAFCAALIAMFVSPAFGEELKPHAQDTFLATASSDHSSVVTAASGKAGSGISGVSIENGAVILRGHLLEAPYIVSRTDKEVRVNGQLVALVANGVAFEPCETMARIERELFEGQNVLVFGSNIVGSISDEGCITLLGMLAQEENLYRRIELILYSDLQGVDDVTTAEWKTALQEINVDENFVQQYLEYESEVGGELASEVLEDESGGSFLVHDSTQTMYGLSVVGMLLIALSAGTLLGHPPRNSRKWSRIVRSPRTLAAMQRCLVLIAAYSLFDLAATLLAVKTGHVEELNPFGVGLILAPTALAAFKVASVCLGAGLLWKLKNYHGAQVASWWLCMVLTLVTVRWVTVQSLFFV